MGELEVMMNDISLDKETRDRAGTYVAQVYVIHQNGFVLLSREYKSGCMSADPQLTGGFLSAINSFTQNLTGGNECAWDVNGRHRLVDIGMTCSRWFIKSNGDYTVAMLLSNDSPLIQKELWDTIDDIAARIVDSFEVFRLFSSSTGTIDLFLDHSDDFGNTVDNILFETISEQTGEELDYKEGTKIDLEDPNVSMR